MKNKIKISSIIIIVFLSLAVIRIALINVLAYQNKDKPNNPNIENSIMSIFYNNGAINHNYERYNDYYEEEDYYDGEEYFEDYNNEDYEPETEENN